MCPSILDDVKAYLQQQRNDGCTCVTTLFEKIPYICAQMGVPCIRFLDVVRLEGWKF